MVTPVQPWLCFEGANGCFKNTRTGILEDLPLEDAWEKAFAQTSIGTIRDFFALRRMRGCCKGRLRSVRRQARCKVCESTGRQHDAGERSGRKSNTT